MEATIDAGVNPTYSVIIYPASELPKQYHALILSKWLRSFRFGNPQVKKTSSDEYYREWQRHIERLAMMPESVVRLAVLTDDSDVVLGFSVCRGDILDYVHVHGDYRRTGIGRKLVPPNIKQFTHYTNIAGLIWQGNKKYQHLKFNPFAGLREIK